jgi:hypothetical protein
MRRTVQIGLVLAIGLIAIGSVAAVQEVILTATGTATVHNPTISAVFVSGNIGTPYSFGGAPSQAPAVSCTVTNSGEGLSCPSVSMQTGDYAVFSTVVRNTGTALVNITLTITPANSAVLHIVPVSAPNWIAAGDNQTYSFTLTAVSAGSSQFTVTVSAIGQY